MPWQQCTQTLDQVRVSQTAILGSSISPAGTARQVELGRPQRYESKTHHGNIHDRGVIEHLGWDCAYKQQAAASVR